MKSTINLGILPGNVLARAHLYACKRFITVSTHACNDAVLGDCGRFPLYINAGKRLM